MKLPVAWRRDPTASRLLIMIGLVTSALSVTARLWSDRQPVHSWQNAVGFAPALLILPLAVVILIIAVRRTAPTKREFDVADGAFRLQPSIPFGLNVLWQLQLTAMLVGTAFSPDRRDPEDPAFFNAFETGFQVFAVGMALLVLLVFVTLGWRGARYELTPEGIRWQGHTYSLAIPWEALAPGGPERPALTVMRGTRIQLATTRPQLVVKRGWIPFYGSREFPVLYLQVNIHPWLLADAIRWYVEHPEDRAAIGTKSEHDRLIATLVGPVAEAPVQAPPPKPVTVAVWLTRAGVVWGLLWGGWNLLVALAFHGRIVAAEQASFLADQEFTGEPPGEPLLGGAETATAYSVALLVVAVLAGVAGLALAHRTRKGDNPARIGLVILSGLVTLTGALGSCCGPPALVLTEGPANGLLGSIILLAMFTNSAVLSILGVAVLILLMVPVSQRYFRPVAVPN